MGSMAAELVLAVASAFQYSSSTPLSCFSFSLGRVCLNLNRLIVLSFALAGTASAVAVL
jgi:hypothetical protein